MGLRITGVGEILVAAARFGLFDFETTLERLGQTSFRMGAPTRRTINNAAIAKKELSFEDGFWFPASIAIDATHPPNGSDCSAPVKISSALGVIRYLPNFNRCAVNRGSLAFRIFL